jgi:DNA-binding MarR family transcriptional regulator
MKDATSLPGFEHSNLSMLVAAARRSIKHAVAPLLEPLDLTPHQAWMVLLIRETGSLSLTELANRMWLDHPTTSRLVHSLEVRQILQIKQDPTHGRRIRIGISEEGAAFAEMLFMAAENFRERMERDLSEEEKDVFRAVLRKLLGNLAEISAELPKSKSAPRTRDLEPD